MVRKNVDIITKYAYNKVIKQFVSWMKDAKGRENATFFNGRTCKMERET